MPRDVQKALDALRDQEKSLQRQRALQRGAERRVQKDW